LTDPETCQQIELGARWSLLDNRLALTMAAFEIKK